MSSFFYRGHETNGPFFAKRDHKIFNAYQVNRGHETFSLLHFRAMKKIGVAPKGLRNISGSPPENTPANI